jgi:hypothetical protein
MKNKVIYTAIFGDKDKLRNPVIIDKEFDYICFTDQSLSSKIWKIKKLKIEDNLTSVRMARKIKILSHKYLSNYDYSIWVDGNILIKKKLSDLLYRLLKNHDIATFNHNYDSRGKRNCIYKEAEYILENNKSFFRDNSEIIKKQILYYKENNYPEDYGLASSSVIFRRHQKNNIISFMQGWWQQLEMFSFRDQLSFNYVAWKNHLSINYINFDVQKNRYFETKKHRQTIKGSLHGFYLDLKRKIINFIKRFFKF